MGNLFGRRRQPEPEKTPIIPVPDDNAIKTQNNKIQAKKQKTSGRLSTVLSESETLG